jgi:hypothetical protein
MADKKKGLTIVEKYDVVKAMLNGTYKGEVSVADMVAFIDERMAQTAKKNSAKGGEPTKAQKEKMAEHTAIENEVLSVMVADTKYTVSDLVKLTSVESTQRLTPRLTALVDNGKIAKTEDKGRSYYSLVVASDEGEGE